MKKKVISLGLAIVMCFSLTVSAFAISTETETVSGTVLEDSETVRTVATMTGNITYISEYDKERNMLTVSEIVNDVTKETTVLNLSELMINCTSSGGNSKADGTRIGYEHTFMNFEYEEYLFDDYPGDAFWFIRNPHFDPDERSIYEHPINNSEYTDCINEYVDAVETINSAEGVIGVAGALAVGGWLVSKGTIPYPQLQAGITAVLESLGVFGAGTAVNDIAQSVETCDTVWHEIFGAYA